MNSLFLTLLLNFLNKTQDRLISILSDNLTKPLWNAIRKIWINSKTFFIQCIWATLPCRVLLIVSGACGLFFVGKKVYQEHLQTFTTTSFAGLVQAVSYQTPGGPPTVIDSALWMRNGAVESGFMMEQLLPGKCKDTQQYIIYYAPPGCTLPIRLPDGSLVELDVDSWIRVPCDFGQTSREVEVSGQAFFTVNTDAGKVFTVHTDAEDITVLGTSFNVNSYRENNLCQISVLSGKVLITPRDNSSKLKQVKVLLQADSCAIVNRQTGDTKVDEFRHDVVLGWRDGKYICINTPLERICKIAGRVYNESIRIDNTAIGQQRIDMTFYRRKPVTHFLKQLQANNDSLDYYRDDQGIPHITHK